MADLVFGAALGFSLTVTSGSYSPVTVHRLLIAVASLVAEHGLWGAQASVVAAHGFISCGSQAPEHRLNSCGSRAQLLQGMWDLPTSGIKAVFPHWQADALPLSRQVSP